MSANNNTTNNNKKRSADDADMNNIVICDTSKKASMEPKPETRTVFFQYVLDHPELAWNYREMSRNPQITPENVINHPKLKWSTDILIVNSNFDWDTIKGMLETMQLHSHARYGMCLGNYGLNSNCTIEWINQYFAEGHPEMDDLNWEHLCNMFGMTLYSRDFVTMDYVLQNKQINVANRTYEWNIDALVHQRNFIHFDIKRIQATIAAGKIDEDWLYIIDVSSHNPSIDAKDLKPHFEQWVTTNELLAHFPKRTWNDNLTLAEMRDIVKIYPPFRQPCTLHVFGGCYSMRLEDIEILLQEINDIPEDHSTMIATQGGVTSIDLGINLSFNPHLTIAFIEKHPEIAWNYGVLSANKMDLDPLHSILGPLYVLK